MLHAKKPCWSRLNHVESVWCSKRTPYFRDLPSKEGFSPSVNSGMPSCLIFDRFESISFLRIVNHYGNVKKGATIHHRTSTPKETSLQSFPFCLLVELHMLQTLLMCTQQRVLDVRVWQILGAKRWCIWTDNRPIGSYRIGSRCASLLELTSLRTLP